jgi:hypothetical protein
LAARRSCGFPFGQSVAPVGWNWNLQNQIEILLPISLAAIHSMRIVRA